MTDVAEKKKKKKKKLWVTEEGNDATLRQKTSPDFQIEGGEGGGGQVELLHDVRDARGVLEGRLQGWW